ncbi:translation initiation factor eIF-2B subunit family protein [Apiospora kogelbergensis]|uniref:Translation initiation factor eIF-2B subunit family protein n=1 Tax=Apiospora kogelbergensis TaxID=1337665 RepID=A0AAW0R2E5_9PEZI
MAAIQKREFAVSFLFKYDPDNTHKAQVALFRDIDSARYFKPKLVPISGVVDRERDANPLATALRLIEEEATLDFTSNSIELLRRGKPYTYVRESPGRQGTVYPFAFRLEDGGGAEARITADRLQVGWGWHDPLEAAGSDELFGGVPWWKDSLRRVWPEIDLGAEAGGVLAAGLERLQTDHESGARQLAAVAVSILRDVVVAVAESGSDSDGAAAALDGTWWAKIRMVAWHIWKNGRESMGAAIVSALVTTLDRVENVLEVNRSPDGGQRLRQILRTINDYLAGRESAVWKIQSSFLQHNRDRRTTCNKSPPGLTVLTLSSSSTISTCLLQAIRDTDVGTTLDIRILESRPLCEGVTLASKLLSETRQTDPGLGERVRITLYSDASAALASEGVDLVLLGADRISAAGDVSNKTGSLPAVLSAKHVAPGAQVVVLSEVEKVAGPGEAGAHAAEENDAAELMQGWRLGGVKGAERVVEESINSSAIELDLMHSPNLEVKNIYFEWVPAHLIDVYITEEGVWSVNEIRQRSDWIGAEIQRFFGDL